MKSDTTPPVGPIDCDDRTARRQAGRVIPKIPNTSAEPARHSGKQLDKITQGCAVEGPERRGEYPGTGVLTTP